MTTTTSATGSNTFLGTMASMFTGATSDAASMFAGSVRTKLDLGLNKERPKLIDPEAAAHQISENFHRAQARVINSANGLSENGVKLAGVTGRGYVASNDASSNSRLGVTQTGSNFAQFRAMGRIAA